MSIIDFQQIEHLSLSQIISLIDDLVERINEHTRRKNSGIDEFFKAQNRSFRAYLEYARKDDHQVKISYVRVITDQTGWDKFAKSKEFRDIRTKLVEDWWKLEWQNKSLIRRVSALTERLEYLKMSNESEIIVSNYGEFDV